MTDFIRPFSSAEQFVNDPSEAPSKKGAFSLEQSSAQEETPKPAGVPDYFWKNSVAYFNSLMQGK